MNIVNQCECKPTKQFDPKAWANGGICVACGCPIVLRAAKCTCEKIRAAASIMGSVGGSAKVAKGFASPRVQAKAQATHRARAAERAASVPAEVSGYMSRVRARMAAAKQAENQKTGDVK